MMLWLASWGALTGLVFGAAGPVEGQSLGGGAVTCACPCRGAGEGTAGQASVGDAAEEQAAGLSDELVAQLAAPEPPLRINPYVAPCPLAGRTLRFGLIDEVYPAIPVWDSWTPVFGDNLPLSDAQLAWLAGDEELARAISDEMEARGGRVFGGLLGSSVGVATSMVGWMLFGAGTVPQQYSLTIGLGGIIMAAVGMIYTLQALQAPLEPFLTPTPSHRLTRRQAYEMITRLNERRDALLCEVRLPAGALPAVADAATDAQLQPLVAPQLEQR